MKTGVRDITENNINLFYQEKDCDIGKDIISMLKNLYEDVSDLEILIINQIPYFKSIYLEDKINKILNGDIYKLKNFSVNVFDSCNRISIKNFDGSEFDIFSNDKNFSIIFLRKCSADFIISKIIQRDKSYPMIVKKSYFKNLVEFR